MEKGGFLEKKIGANRGAPPPLNPPLSTTENAITRNEVHWDNLTQTENSDSMLQNVMLITLSWRVTKSTLRATASTSTAAETNVHQQSTW